MSRRLDELSEEAARSLFRPSSLSIAALGENLTRLAELPGPVAAEFSEVAARAALDEEAFFEPFFLLAKDVLKEVQEASESLGALLGKGGLLYWSSSPSGEPEQVGEVSRLSASLRRARFAQSELTREVNVDLLRDASAARERLQELREQERQVSAQPPPKEALSALRSSLAGIERSVDSLLSKRTQWDLANFRDLALRALASSSLAWIESYDDLSDEQFAAVVATEVALERLQERTSPFGDLVALEADLTAVEVNSRLRLKGRAYDPNMLGRRRHQLGASELGQGEWLLTSNSLGKPVQVSSEPDLLYLGTGVRLPDTYFSSPSAWVGVPFQAEAENPLADLEEATVEALPELGDLANPLTSIDEVWLVWDSSAEEIRAYQATVTEWTLSGTDVVPGSANWDLVAATPYPGTLARLGLGVPLNSLRVLPAEGDLFVFGAEVYALQAGDVSDLSRDWISVPLDLASPLEGPVPVALIREGMLDEQSETSRWSLPSPGTSLTGRTLSWYEGQDLAWGVATELEEPDGGSVVISLSPSPELLGSEPGTPRAVDFFVGRVFEGQTPYFRLSEAAESSVGDRIVLDLPAPAGVPWSTALPDEAEGEYQLQVLQAFDTTLCASLLLPFDSLLPETAGTLWRGAATGQLILFRDPLLVFEVMQLRSDGIRARLLEGTLGSTWAGGPAEITSRRTSNVLQVYDPGGDPVDLYQALYSLIEDKTGAPVEDAVTLGLPFPRSLSFFVNGSPVTSSVLSRRSVQVSKELPLAAQDVSCELLCQDESQSRFATVAVRDPRSDFPALPYVIEEDSSVLCTDLDSKVTLTLEEGKISEVPSVVRARGTVRGSRTVVLTQGGAPGFGRYAWVERRLQDRDTPSLQRLADAIGNAVADRGRSRTTVITAANLLVEDDEAVLQVFGLPPERVEGMDLVILDGGARFRISSATSVPMGTKITTTSPLPPEEHQVALQETSLSRAWRELRAVQAYLRYLQDTLLRVESPYFTYLQPAVERLRSEGYSSAAEVLRSCDFEAWAAPFSSVQEDATLSEKVESLVQSLVVRREPPLGG